jgi:nucleolar GTP-binding protein
MNFQNIPPVENSKSLLELAFSRARIKGRQKTLKGNWLQIIRKKECLKLDIIKDTLVPRLEKILLDFPNESDLSSFYLKLIKLTLDYPTWKKSLGAMKWAQNKTRFFQKEYVSKIIKEKDRAVISQLSKQFYGRLSSVLKQIDDNLAYLEYSRKIMRTYPDVKEMFTVCLYGLPNVGKTTLLNKLTGTRAEVNSYAFTTKSINAGYFKINGKKVQVLDVPGTLARKDKMNNIEFQAELVLKELADQIIYVYDLSEFSGYSVKKQEQLLQNLGKKRNIIIYLSKQDILSAETLKDFKHKHYSIEEIKERIGTLLEGK